LPAQIFISPILRAVLNSKNHGQLVDSDGWRIKSNNAAYIDRESHGDGWGHRGIQGGISWCMLFVKYVIFMDESMTEVDQKLKLWRRTFKAKYFRFSRSKIEYMKCDLSATIQEEWDVRLIVKWYPRKTVFTTWKWYSRSMGIWMKMLVIELKPPE
jgi:hypothetical protein